MYKKIAMAAAGAAMIAVSASGSANAGPVLNAIKQKDFIQCGVNTGLAGFGIADSQGNWTGIDVDFCRGLAAALLGDRNKVKFTPLSAPQRFTALQSGEIDVLSRNTTNTLTRDASLGLHFVGVWYYDGQGFMVPRRLNVKGAKELNGAEICVQAGTTTELNLTDYFRANRMTFKPVVFESAEEWRKAFFAGRCQATTTDVSALASVRSVDAQNPDDFVILPEVISKEPLGPMVRRGDDEWFAVTKWVLNLMLEAEEKGITTENVDQMRSSTDPTVQRLIGNRDEMGKKLGLAEDWGYKVIKQVGNYGESFERNIGKKTPLRLDRGLNAQWTQGGLMYGMPAR
ncbi:MAG: amino acid ABC transporter substrate-binding protein [Alphaproteobacteria bacterium]|nr:amino acid ABC transporter substrate-binding protein [Alphaproteobacteria bacterium]